MAPFFCFGQKFTPAEVQRFRAEARSVTIIRDNYGVPHIYGKTDANVVFGLMYTECEDNFKGIEQNHNGCRHTQCPERAKNRRPTDRPE